MGGNITKWEKPGYALITGASAGLGAVFARKFALLGFSPILVARRRNKLEEVAKTIRNTLESLRSGKKKEKKKSADEIDIKILTADLTSDDGITAVEEIIKDVGGVDVLINNAGFGTRGYFVDLPRNKIEKMNALHITAPVRLIKTALPYMLRKGRGAIINVSSLASFIPTADGVVYAATKSYLRTFSEALHFELMGTGVRVMALCPGFTKTEFHSVGDYAGFDRSVYPEFLWMTADEVVKKGIRALQKGKVVYIPGFKNRFFKKLIGMPLLGRKLHKAIQPKPNNEK